MEIAMEAGAKVVGVNNRNLHTFEVDMGTTGRIAKMLPPSGGGVQLLALSGVATRADAVDLQGVGANGILVSSQSRTHRPTSACLHPFFHSLFSPPPVWCHLAGGRVPYARSLARGADPRAAGTS